MKGRRALKEPYKKAYLKKKKYNSTASHGFTRFKEDPAALHQGTPHLHGASALHHLLRDSG